MAKKQVKQVKTSKGIKGALVLATKKKYYTLSEKLAEKKSVRDFILDELTVPSAERKTRRDLIFEIIKEYYISRPNAYKIYNEVVSEVNPQESFTKYEIQIFLYDEYTTAIDAAYDQDELDVKSIAMLLAGLQKLKENWVDMPTEQEELPVPIFSSQPTLLPNYKPEMQAKIDALVATLRAKKAEPIEDIAHEEL
ncbi:hypothetical protein VB796_08705 [Arcicella sp. LKC2W]|uniref:hypothetical protein n=1 Tax=Arcicella sp. LKC2W TaxID=2984198 RepID=UPI002B21DF0C|nr:hypothetical protein [Arcicella sp. LKC2W]MEA5459114.1 hypothetical protein [Arcicella sp. LKC2W]